MLLPAIIYLICIIYIYFSILHRCILNGLCFLLNGIRKVITVSRIILRCMRGVLRGFIKIIGVSVSTLNKIPFVDQLHKLVAVCLWWHPYCLPYGGRGERKCKSVCVGGKV